MARACILYGPRCSNGGRAVPGTSRCTAHGGGHKDKRPGEYGAEHQRLSKVVIKQAQGKCANPDCTQVVGPANPLQGDHIIPITEGGQTVESNYQALCRICNISKGGSNRRPRQKL
jgi:5-methylcytosine-specific restriction endonuclease McrA